MAFRKSGAFYTGAGCATEIPWMDLLPDNAGYVTPVGHESCHPGLAATHAIHQGIPIPCFQYRISMNFMKGTSGQGIMGMRSPSVRNDMSL